jgi:hypothetical protein
MNALVIAGLARGRAGRRHGSCGVGMLDSGGEYERGARGPRCASRHIYPI